MKTLLLSCLSLVICSCGTQPGVVQFSAKEPGGSGIQAIYNCALTTPMAETYQAVLFASGDEEASVNGVGGSVTTYFAAGDTSSDAQGFELQNASGTYVLSSDHTTLTVTCIQTAAEVQGHDVCWGGLEPSTFTIPCTTAAN